MRRDGWETRFRETLEAWEHKPFQWGETDCAHFAAAVVLALTGRDFLGTWRGAYTSRLTAAARLRGRGHRTLATALGEALAAIGAQEIDPRAAAVGDVGVTADDISCVRCPAGWLARREDGSFGVAEAVKAWAV